MIDNNLLLVEGSNDEHVFYSLLNFYKVPDSFSIINEGGVDSLLEDLGVRLKQSDLQTLGIVIDADSDLTLRWGALVKILNKAGYVGVPTCPDPGGTVIETADKPRVGIWLMPDNTLPGMLEDFISFLVPNRSSDLLWNYAGQCLSQARTISTKKIPQAKAHIHTWLAWQEDPGTPLGLAITKKYLDANVPQAQKLIEWLKVLYNL